MFNWVYLILIYLNIAYGLKEWNCSIDANIGIYQLSNNCTISGENHVNISNVLEINGTDPYNNNSINNLVVVTAALNHRHFYISGE